ncbi:MAG: DUF1592 domain-containing protein [Bryobacteraceae bacterium]
MRHTWARASRTRIFILAVTLGWLATLPAPSADPSDAALDRQFNQTVKPFLSKYCMGCHGTKTPAAQFDLRPYSTTAAVIKDLGHWHLVNEKLTTEQMPPKVAPQPPAEARKKITEWIQAMERSEARKHAGDPGPVMTRRLSNAEYNNTIRDLTGFDIQPAREFPVDPANTEGFDNSAESLVLSPGLFNKYLQAAHEVSDHMVLKPEGFDFAPHPMLAATDRDRYSVQRILDFYARQPTEYAAYFEAAWRYKNRVALGKPQATLATAAAETKVSAKYLPMIWALLEDPTEPGKPEVGPTAKLQAMWKALPAQAEAPKAKFMEMRDFATRIRNHTAKQFAAPIVRGLPAGSQPLLNWKLLQFNQHRREFDPKALLNDTDPAPELPAMPRYPGLHRDAAPRWAALMDRARAGDTDLIVPAAQRPRYEASFARFASVFPDVFYVSERGRYFPDDSDDKGRFLSAGYHNVMGFWRDDVPLMELILDPQGQKELNRLWDEFDFAADHTARTWNEFYFNQSGAVDTGDPEDGRPRPTDKALDDPAVIFDLRNDYMVKALEDPENDPMAVDAITVHFQTINDTLRRIQKMRVDAEPSHVDSLLRFAERAFRRPLSQKEKDDWRNYYRSLRDKDGLSHEDAIRDSIISVLISPQFCYRLDLGDASQQVTSAAAKPANKKAPVTTPLSAFSLASRLSYFLWASMPDDALLAAAASGDLQKPSVLLAQAKRMLQDPRARGMALEFGGNWLDFRRFEQHNAVDRDRFPSFTNDLRQAMFEEPVRMLTDMVQNDRSVLDLIYGNYTFVNPVLAKHYGMPDTGAAPDHWTRIDDAGKFGRGGLLPMSVFLTQNAPGLRTSPVKRGYWVVRRVLGETIPPPPPSVPELPKDESTMVRPLREMLALHRENPLCGGCHARFDTFGLALENYGPVGERRTQDLAGRAIDTEAALPGGFTANGFTGVQDYIRLHRQDGYLDNFSRKLLSYALSRSLIPSDELLIDSMRSRLSQQDYRFSTLVESLVTSPQFLSHRNPEATPIEKGKR